MNKDEALEQPEPEPEWYQGIDAHGCNRFYHKTEVRPSEFNTPLYTSPPKREPLTNGEIYTAYITATNQTLRAQDERLAFAFARAIEAAHGIGEKK